MSCSFYEKNFTFAVYEKRNDTPTLALDMLIYLVNIKLIVATVLRNK
jgi:hypothetical protein